jgi:uncharacterized protein (TIGR02001 family)
MTRRSREVGIVKSCVLSAALAVGLALPAQADENKLKLSASVWLTTDYIFRGISQTLNDPAIQGSVTASYGIFYAGFWASNVDFGAGVGPGGAVQSISDLEIDYYVGILPTWKGFTFDIAGLYYTYPSACDFCLGGELDYFELKTGAKYTFNEKLTLGITNYWSPDFSVETGNGDALELSAGYAFGWKPFNFFSPSVSALVGWQWVDDNAGWDPYTYWNAGLTLGFMNNWSVDVRYWDTDLSGADVSAGTFSDSRVVGTLAATF